MNHIEETIQQLSREIALRQDVINGLSRLREGRAAAEARPRPVRAPGLQTSPATPTRLEDVRRKSADLPEKRVKRKYTRRAAAAEAGLPTTPAEPAIPATLDKPTTVGGAMKAVIRALPPGWTCEDVKAGLMADADWAKLFEAASPSLLNTNLSYWADHGKLAMDGESPAKATFKVTDKEFFAP